MPIEGGFLRLGEFSCINRLPILIYCNNNNFNVINDS